jgi:hypothetical protein
LAGIEYSEDTFSTANAVIRHATATSNPVAVAQFFYYTCKGVFNELVGSNTGRIGILGEVANYFGVVETNGRRMLYLHGLIWVTSNLAFATLRDRLLQDKSFASRMIRYLETAIVQSIDLVIAVPALNRGSCYLLLKTRRLTMEPGDCFMHLFQLRYILDSYCGKVFVSYLLYYELYNER